LYEGGIGLESVGEFGVLASSFAAIVGMVGMVGSVDMIALCMVYSIEVDLRALSFEAEDREVVFIAESVLDVTRSGVKRLRTLV
jgi:hypothetical protein